METRKTPLVLTASALAMALVLVGCGGGSSGSPQANTTALSAPPATMPDPTPEPEPEPEPMPVELPKLPMGDMYAFMLDDGDHTIKAGESLPAGGVMLSCPADGEDCMVTVDGDTVTYTGVMVTAMRTEAAEEAYQTEMAAMADEMNRRAAGLHEALTNNAGSHVFDGGFMVTPVQIPQSPRTAGATHPTNIVITRGLTGDLMVMRDRAGWQGDAMAAASLGAEGWAGQVLMHAGGAQKITVYSNIENAVRQDFEDDATSIYRPGLAQGAIPHLPTATTDAAGSANPGDPEGLVLNAEAMQDAYEQGLLDTRYFPKAGTPGSRTLTYTYQNGADPGPRNFEEVLPGATFHGASGTYHCTTGGGCSINVTPASITAPATYTVRAGDTWEFVPDRPVGVGDDAQIHRQDNDWLSFGYWISEPENARPGGAFLYNAQVFFGGANVFEGTAVSALPTRQNATYEGRAAGLYARLADADDDIAAARGEFMADATLTARFGMGTAPAATANVGGTIDNFTNGDGIDMSEWSLTLDRTAVVTGAPGGNVDNGRVMSGTNPAIAGRWDAQLYGPSRPGELPSGIAGRFHANIDAGTAVAGAFGAE